MSLHEGTSLPLLIEFPHEEWYQIKGKTKAQLKDDDNDDIRILQWQKRGRKRTRPSETVGYVEEEDETEEDNETSLKYKETRVKG